MVSLLKIGSTNWFVIIPNKGVLDNLIFSIDWIEKSRGLFPKETNSMYPSRNSEFNNESEIPRIWGLY